MRSLRATMWRGLAWTLAALLWLRPAPGPAPARAAELAGAETTAKVDAAVLAATAGGGQADFVILLAEQADLSGAAGLRSRAAKGRYVFERLTETAARSQKPLRQTLAALGAAYRPYYIVNAIGARGDRAVLEALARSPLVARIESDAPVAASLPRPGTTAGRAAPLAPAGVEWNVARVNADDVWGLGYTGQGIVVADQDTGFQWDHPAVIDQYRGWDGGSADHNFNWWDAIHEDISGDSGNPCGFDLAAPCDDFGHGTHTLGTAVGDDGLGNQVGVAPGAQWIGCRNMDSGVGRPTTYMECFEFFLAPWDLNQENANPALAPDVISNSWTCPDYELCTGSSLLTTVANVRAAGIVVVAAAGNDGSACSTVSEEPAFFADLTSVGATDSSDLIASFSSRGPVTADSSNRIKPDISAPGVAVRSSIPGSAFANSSGTSMATPHVAGAVALLLSADAGYEGDVAAIEERLYLTAHRLTSGQECGGVPGTHIPNNTFGWGLLDAYALVTAKLYHFPLVAK